jgi:adenylate cyclase
MANPAKSLNGKIFRHILAGGIIGALAISLVVGLGRLSGVRGAFAALDAVMYDTFYRMRPPEDKSDGPVVLIAVDDASLDKVDQQIGIGWPWPRAFWGSVIQFCNNHGARAVVFDITFNQHAATKDDAVLAAAADNSKIPVIFANLELPDGKWDRFIPRGKKPPIFGAVNFDQGVARGYVPVTAHGQDSLATAAIKASGLTPKWPTTDPFLLRFYGPQQYTDASGTGRRTFKYISAINVLAAAGNPTTRGLTDNGLGDADFRDKIVLVAGISAAMYDLKSTPLSNITPGAELHATAIENMLDADRVETVPAALRLGLGLLVAIIGACGAILPRRLWMKLALALAAFAIAVVVPMELFQRETIRWLAPGEPMLGSIVAVVAALGWSYLIEDKDRRLFVKALSQYVSPAVAADLQRNSDRLKIDSERREMTVMFTDIAGFTDLSEKLDPERLSELLRFYFGQMTHLIWKEEGTLDKFVGDAIVAFWNPPISPQTDHALRACRAAIAMRQREIEMTDELNLRGGNNMHTRIGLNTGAMAAGTFGSDEKFNYTVMGDSVNLASRLEAANKYYGTRLLISEVTAVEVRSAFLLRKIDVITVKGKTQPMAVFEPLCEGAGPAALRDLADRYQSALERYMGRYWSDAQAMLQKLKKDFPDDGPTGTLLQRVIEYAADPPGDQWDGVYRFKTK